MSGATLRQIVLVILLFGTSCWAVAMTLTIGEIRSIYVDRELCKLPPVPLVRKPTTPPPRGH